MLAAGVDTDDGMFLLVWLRMHGIRLVPAVVNPIFSHSLTLTLTLSIYLMSSWICLNQELNMPRVIRSKPVRLFRDFSVFTVTASRSRAAHPPRRLASIGPVGVALHHASRCVESVDFGLA